jgi:hypothetical protein
VLLQTHRGANSSVTILVIVTPGYFDFMVNWICWLRRLSSESGRELESLVLIAVTDQTSLELCKLHSIHCSIVEAGSSGHLPAASYESVEFQMLMLWRAKLVRDLLAHGTSVLLSDIDTVWLDNPLEYIDSVVDVQGS